MLARFLLLALGATTALAGNAFMPSLPDEVMADLARRDPSEYQTFALRDAEDGELDKRGPPSNLYGIQTRCTTSKCYAFTFDDGPYKHMRQLTDKAVSSGVKATFFVNVQNYDNIYNYADDLRYAYSKGMHICSHTATHAHLNSLTHAQIDKEVQDVETALWNIIGAVPSCIRPPYGEANEDVVNYLNNRHNLVVINWNFDSGDSVGASVEDSKVILRGIKSPKHAIVLMHETVDTTPSELFPAAIKIAKNNGYTTASFQTIPQSLRFNGYKVVKK